MKKIVFHSKVAQCHTKVSNGPQPLGVRSRLSGPREGTVPLSGSEIPQPGSLTTNWPVSFATEIPID